MIYETQFCAACGVPFRVPTAFMPVLYCSAACRVSVQPPRNDWEHKGNTRCRYYNPRRRKKILEGDLIDPFIIYRVYKGMCHLCRTPIDPALLFPNPMCATIDHLDPLSNGGKHVWDNCKPAHKICNEER